MNDTGYWKGKPCHSIPVAHTEDGKTWCATHYTVALHNPERFANAQRTYERKMAARAALTKEASRG